MNAPRRFAGFALLIALAFEAGAQDHSHHQAPPATPAQTPLKVQALPPPEPPASPRSATPVDHAAMGHARPPADADLDAMDHAGMGQDAIPRAPNDHAHGDHATTDHATMDHAVMEHDATPPASNDQAGIDHSQMDHSAMDHAAMGHAMPPVPGQPATPIPVVTDADRAAAVPPAHAHPMHDNAPHSFVLLDRLEAFDADGDTGLAWEAQAWFGTDLDKLWLRSEGERVAGHAEHANIEVLYGRAIAPWWELVAGLRHDIAPGGSQDFLAVGVQGLAPYKFEVQATAYLGTSGQTALRLAAEYDTLLTNRLILQPLLEVEFHGKDDPHRGIGAGLGTAEAGLRLRYEVTRQVAPYIGIVRERAFGGTARWRRAHGAAVDETHVVAGLRFWF